MKKKFISKENERGKIEILNRNLTYNNSYHNSTVFTNKKINFSNIMNAVPIILHFENSKSIHYDTTS